MRVAGAKDSSLGTRGITVCTHELLVARQLNGRKMLLKIRIDERKSGYLLVLSPEGEELIKCTVNSFTG